MKILRDLRRFVLAKDNDDERHEIRSYVLENVDTIASAFGVTGEAIKNGLDKVEDDAALARRLITEVKRIDASGREQRVERRAQAAQSSAEVLAGVARWNGDAAHFDLISVLASVLTRPQDLLVFTADAFTVAIFMAPLMNLSRLDRTDLTAFVDAKGLHIRWERGGLNLRPQTDPSAERVTFPLPAPVSIAA